MPLSSTTTTTTSDTTYTPDSDNSTFNMDKQPFMFPKTSESNDVGLSASREVVQRVARDDICESLSRHTDAFFRELSQAAKQLHESLPTLRNSTQLYPTSFGTHTEPDKNINMPILARIIKEKDPSSKFSPPHEKQERITNGMRGLDLKTTKDYPLSYGEMFNYQPNHFGKTFFREKETQGLADNTDPVPENSIDLREDRMTLMHDEAREILGLGEYYLISQDTLNLHFRRALDRNPLYVKMYTAAYDTIKEFQEIHAEYYKLWPGQQCDILKEEMMAYVDGGHRWPLEDDQLRSLDSIMAHMSELNDLGTKPNQGPSPLSHRVIFQDQDEIMGLDSPRKTLAKEIKQEARPTLQAYWEDVSDSAATSWGVESVGKAYNNEKGDTTLKNQPSEWGGTEPATAKALESKPADPAIPTAPTAKDLIATYWITVESGDKTVHVPINGNHVLGPEKDIVNVEMKTVWDWVCDKGLNGIVSLQDTFDLAQNLHDLRKDAS
ncbi:hypothetical protein BS50DRAFT_581207 [Corynespora cassiicola Philippines]|uniref:Uncharacterized protein n=1 Tax=Corynespora cassiicola Philippines TaxID=1448308 RepID=A0A2T2P9P8_CORCC|nr:hypothetical protein BS50DRAFT_581207 [Corynespora cassiicola Philippines]